VVVRFVNIGGIVDKHYLNVLFINLNYIVFQPSNEGYYRKVACALNLVSTFVLKERNNLTCNQSPVTTHL